MKERVKSIMMGALRVLSRPSWRVRLLLLSRDQLSLRRAISPLSYSAHFHELDTRVRIIVREQVKKGEPEPGVQIRRSWFSLKQSSFNSVERISGWRLANGIQSALLSEGLGSEYLQEIL
jgi:hypothetical protein